MSSIVLLAALSAASQQPVATAHNAVVIPAESVSDPWLVCLRNQFATDARDGVKASWPVASALPAVGADAVIALPSEPSGPAYDAVHYALYVYKPSGTVFVSQRGGIADFHTFYGPLPIQGRCSEPAASAP